ncbi:MAG: RNA polymerase sigma-70 factor [Bacteroidota bacterium]
MGFVSEEILVREIKNSSSRHFKLLYERYWSKLYVIANNVLRNEADAEDVVQELFISFWNRRSTLVIDNLGGYLYTAVRYNVAKKLSKRPLQRNHQELFEAIQDKANLELSLEFKDLVDFIRGKIDELPDRCKEVFELSRFEQLSNKEIAQKLNISTSTVENQINKALKNLRDDDATRDELAYLIFIVLLTQY